MIARFFVTAFICVPDIVLVLDSHSRKSILQPPAGNVSIVLMSSTGGASYNIAASYPAISQAGYCDSGAGVGTVIPGKTCGRIEFVVPSDWAVGNCE